MDLIKGEIGSMFWSNRKCVKKVRLELFQIYLINIIERFKKMYGATWSTHESEIHAYICMKYKDNYLQLIAKASILGYLDEEESKLLQLLQTKRSLEDCKMCLPEFKIKESRRVII